MANNHSTPVHINPSDKTLTNILNVKVMVYHGNKSHTCDLLDICFDRVIGLCDVLAGGIQDSNKNGMDTESFVNVVYLLQDELRIIKYLVSDLPITIPAN